MKKTNVLVGIGTFLCIGGAIASITCLSIFGLNACEVAPGPIIGPNGNIDLGDVEDKTIPFVSVNQTEGSYSKYTYLDLETAALSPLTPSKGDVNVLVVPVQFSDLNPFTEHDYTMIQSGFNGVFKDNSNNYWESCKSFYEKSSNGKLHLNFDITDPFVPKMSSQEFTRIGASDTGEESQRIIKEIYQKGVTQQGNSINLNDRKYDSDKDGYIDGIWLVYNSKNYREVFQEQKYWAYTTTFDPTGLPVTKKLLPGRYANASILFLGQSTKFNEINALNSDAHTMIHETGHMLGLDDYYDYGNRRSDFSYTGQLDMMDLNIGDHNAFSKYALGWTKAKVIEESTTLTLKPFASSYDSLILPSPSYDGHAFGEYLIVEYYTPTNLFKLDSEAKYLNSYPLFFSKSGLRIYHVDARLISLHYKNGFVSTSDYLSKDELMNGIPEYNPISDVEATWTAVGNSNASNISYFKGEPLVELVSADNEILFNRRKASNSSLYTGTNEVVFNKNLQSKYFKDGKFNDGSLMNYEITINEITEEGINITINK